MKTKILSKLGEMIENTEFQSKVYLVGGSVRDYLMGKECKDYDFCVEMENGGILLAEYLTTSYPSLCKNYVIFPNYGTAKFVLEFDDVREDIELVETRRERYTDKNNRNPECVYGTLVDDCFRRDLTINTLYMRIEDMSILDLTKMGVDDIKNKIIRTPCHPDLTYADDPLRLLRTVRFASRYNWDIEEKTLRAMKNNVNRLLIVSKERIADELIKILTCSHPRKALELMKETGLMDTIISEFYYSYSMSQNSFHTGTVWEHTIDVVEKTIPTPTARMAALLHDLGKVNTESFDEETGEIHFYKHELESGILAKTILKDLKFPNDFIDDVVKIVENHMRLKQCGNEAKISDKALRKLKCEIVDVYEDFFSVVDADNKSHSVKGMMPDQVNIIKERFLSLADKGLDISKISLPINGNDVMRELNISPSPMIKEILAYLGEAYLEDPTLTAEKCIEIIIDRYRV